ncbi:MAG: helix-turn-helix domain-containing protein [Armatimonadetes bacterium]|nr:helix-turn-helix domain-containing protein [Armatimonadota bacterium]
MEPDTSPKLLFTVKAAAKRLSLSRAQLYRLIEQGDLDAVLIGRSRRISQSQLDAFIARLEQSKRLTVIH